MRSEVHVFFAFTAKKSSLTADPAGTGLRAIFILNLLSVPTLVTAHPIQHWCHQCWVGWAVTSRVGGRRWIQYYSYEKFILPFIVDQPAMHSSRRGWGLAILAYSALCWAARPLALTACSEVSEYARKRWHGYELARMNLAKPARLAKPTRPRLKSVRIAALSCHRRPAL